MVFPGQFSMFTLAVIVTVWDVVDVFTICNESISPEPFCGLTDNNPELVVAFHVKLAPGTSTFQLTALIELPEQIVWLFGVTETVGVG